MTKTENSYGYELHSLDDAIAHIVDNDTALLNRLGDVEG